MCIRNATGMLIVVTVAVATGCKRVDPEKATAKQLFRDKQVLALVEAAEQGDVAKIDRLVDDGVDVNAHGKSKATPLRRALVARNKEGYLALLKHGADPNLRDDRGNGIIHLAAEAKSTFWLENAIKFGGDVDLVNVGHPFYPDITPIYYAIYKEDRSENVKILIKAGANLNHQDDINQTPLMIASQAAEYECVLALLKAGADYRIKNNHGRDVIDFHFRGRTEDLISAKQLLWFRKVIAFLEKEGVDLSEKPNAE